MSPMRYQTWLAEHNLNLRPDLNAERIRPAGIAVNIRYGKDMNYFFAQGRYRKVGTLKCFNVPTFVEASERLMERERYFTEKTAFFDTHKVKKAIGGVCRRTGIF